VSATAAAAARSIVPAGIGNMIGGASLVAIPFRYVYAGLAGLAGLASLAGRAEHLD